MPSLERASAWRGCHGASHLRGHARPATGGGPPGGETGACFISRGGAFTELGFESTLGRGSQGGCLAYLGFKNLLGLLQVMELPSLALGLCVRMCADGLLSVRLKAVKGFNNMILQAVLAFLEGGHLLLLSDEERRPVLEPFFMEV